MERRTISLEELKQIQLDILVKVHDFCVENQIEYFLSSGTLIGAIRHKGYIPWDDDIDIEMTRPNYDRFLKKFNGTYPELEVFAPEFNWNYYAPYANVCDNRTILIEGDNGHNGYTIGVKIDIFPVDGLPCDEYKCNKIFRKADMYHSLMRYKRFPLSFFLKGGYLKRIVRCIIWNVLHLVSYSLLQKRFHKLATSYKYSDSENAGPILFMGKKCSVNKNTFSQYTDVEFEGQKFKIIKDYDSYLRALYGDYMQLPPANKRIPHHNFEAFWKD